MKPNINHTFLTIILFLLIGIFSGCSSDTDANGNDVNVNLLADDNGQYSIDVTGMTPPFIIGFDSEDNGTGSIDLYSFAKALNTDANVTDLTTLAVFLANNETDLGELYENWASTQLSDADIAAAQEIVNANLQAQIDAIEGLNAEDYDFLSTAFSPDGTGIAALLEAVSLDLTETGFIISIADENQFIFDKGIDTSSIALNDTNTTTTLTGTWCLTIGGSITLNGKTTTAPLEEPECGIPASAVPTEENSASISQLISENYGNVDAAGSLNYEITSSSATEVVASSSFNVGEAYSYNLVLTYTKQP